jgi:glutathionyl-hydroquinone reductase
VNPHGIVPKGPILDFDTPHNRHQLTKVATKA